MGRFRLRLASLIWLVALVAAFLGGMRYEAYRAARAKEAAELRTQADGLKRRLEKIERIASSPSQDPAYVSTKRRLASVESKLKALGGD